MVRIALFLTVLFPSFQEMWKRDHRTTDFCMVLGFGYQPGSRRADWTTPTILGASVLLLILQDGSYSYYCLLPSLTYCHSSSGFVVVLWSSYWYSASATWCFSLQRLSSKLVLHSLRGGADKMHRFASRYSWNVDVSFGHDDDPLPLVCHWQIWTATLVTMVACLFLQPGTRSYLAKRWGPRLHCCILDGFYRFSFCCHGSRVFTWMVPIFLLIIWFAVPIAFCTTTKPASRLVFFTFLAALNTDFLDLFLVAHYQLQCFLDNIFFTDADLREKLGNTIQGQQGTTLQGQQGNSLQGQYRDILVISSFLGSTTVHTHLDVWEFMYYVHAKKMMSKSVEKATLKEWKSGWWLRVTILKKYFK